jgi:hypothetical protein
LAIREEGGQSLSAARTFSVIDLTATLLGVFVFGFAAGRLVHKSRRAVNRRRSA